MFRGGDLQLEPLILVLALVAVALLIWVFRRRKQPLPGEDLPYQRQLYLFSKAERAFHRVLEQVNDDRAVILGKVCVGDVVTPKRSLSRSDRQAYFNRISAKHFDFVLCSKKDLSVLCAIELTDPAQKSESASKKDEFLQQVCDAADVPLVKVAARSKYDLKSIDKLFRRFVPETEKEKDEIYLWTQLQIDPVKKPARRPVKSAEGQG